MNVTANVLHGLTADLGMRLPARGSLDWLLALALTAGALIAGAVGSVAPDRDVSDWLLLASLVLWQPAVEELLFRGVLQGTLRRTMFGRRSRWGLSVANAVTSLAFVSIHFIRQPPLWAAAVVVPSLVFGYFRDRSDSVWPPLVLHIVYNGAFFAMLLAAQ